MTTLLTKIQRFFSYSRAMLSYEQRMANFFNLPASEIDGLYQELGSSQFKNDIIRQAGIKKTGFFDFNMAMVLRAPTLYVLCRICNPEVVVETGVANGFSTAFILQALETNKKGRLYSIDLPNQPGQVLQDGRETGWLVPEELKARWEFLKGPSQVELPKLFSRISKIQMFYHDSDHSYEHMMFEFSTVCPYLSPHGLLVSDDITDNSAFDDYCGKNKFYFIKLFKTGIAQKRQDTV